MFSFLLQNLKLALLLSKPQVRVHLFQKVTAYCPFGTSLLYCFFTFLWISTCFLFSFSFLLSRFGPETEENTSRLPILKNTQNNSMGTLTPYSSSSEASPVLVNPTGCLVLFFLWLVAEGRFVHRSTTVRVHTEFLHLSFCFHTPQEGGS